jgi:hypothetical protein
MLILSRPARAQAWLRAAVPVSPRHVLASLVLAFAALHGAVAATPPAPAVPAATGGKLNGQVHYKWDNGDVYDGEMVDGKRHGKGRMAWANGQSYDGDWRDDVAVGEGALGFANGDRYQGQVKDGIPDGRGRMQYGNGDTYEGVYDKGTIDVEGVYTLKDGSRYEGQWKAGLRNGRGRFAWPSGQRYEGEWVGDKPQGSGSLTFANGDRYEGQVSNGLPQGKGVKTFASQDRYEGLFAEGQPNGAGTYRWKNGDVYVGGWQKGSKAGMGRYTWAGGDYWEGEFADDKKTDNGRLYFTPKATASGADAAAAALNADAVTSPAAGQAVAVRGGTPDDKALDRVRLLAIPMVAKEMRECSRKQGSDCANRVVDAVLNDSLQAHKWQTMSSETDAKGKASVFEVDANSVLEGGNVFSWLRSGDGNRARNIGIKYDCRARALEIQLIYHCTGSQPCTLDPNIDKYAGKVLPATDIKSWFKDACERG